MNREGGTFDLQANLKGIKVPWRKHDFELHVPGYNYLGPATRLDLRLDENSQPKSDSMPIDATDNAALAHDIRYMQADNLNNKDQVLAAKHEADRIMLEELSKIDPSCFRERFAKWIAENAMKLKLKLGMALDPVTKKTIDPLYSPALSKLWVDLALLQSRKAHEANPNEYPPDFLENMKKQAENMKTIISGGTIDYEKEATDLVNQYLTEYDKDAKEYDAYVHEENRKKKEVPFMEKAAEIIEKPFRWLFDWTADQIGVKDNVSYENIQQAIMGTPKWKIREQANLLDEAIRQLDSKIDEFHKQKKFSYNNPELDSIYDKVRNLRKERDEIKNVLGYGIDSKTFASEVHARRVNKFNRRSVYINRLDEIWSADIIFFKTKDRGFTSALTVIDNFSKFGWAIPLKTKKSEELIKAFANIFAESDRFPKKIWFDKETGIYSDAFRGYVAQFGIDVYSTQSELKAVIIERWNRTLKENIYRKFTELGSDKQWVDLLSECVNTYNNTVHSTIKMTPIEASKKENEAIVKEQLDKKIRKYTSKPAKFKVGDKVRITEYKYTFDKGYKQNYTDEVFEINTVHSTVPWTYTLQDKNKELIQGKFYEQEMIHTHFDFD